MRKVEYSLIGIVAVFTAIVLPVFKEGDAMDFGNTSDIVSALCNMVMAGAAIYAAKKWFQQKLLLNSLDVSHKIALDFEEKLWEINDRIFSDVVMRAEFINNIKENRKSHEEVQNSFSLELRKSTTTDLAEFAYLHNSINRLKRNKVHLNENFSQLFNKIILARKDYLDCHYDYLSALSIHYYNIDDPSIAEIYKSLESKQYALAALFERELANIDINSSYNFG
jgi:hypothetical protein